MQSQANPNLNPDAQPRMAPSEQRSTTERQLEHVPGAHPERQAMSTAEKGMKQPTGMSAHPVVTPQAINPANQGSNAVVTTTVQPSLTAADGGKLEKPWVDRADEIIEKTAQDPYMEEEAHEELSALYLKQRFNLDIKRNTPQH